MTARRDEAWTEGHAWRVPGVSDRDRHALSEHRHSPETTRRCGIVLLALEGWSDAAIADHLRLPAGTVAWWRSQFSNDGIAGLIGAPAAAAPTTPSSGRRVRARPPALHHERVAGRSPFPEGHHSAGQPGGLVRAVTRAAHGGDGDAPVDRDRRSGVEPALAAHDVELIGVYVSPEVQLAWLLEVLEPHLVAGRGAEGTDSSNDAGAPSAPDRGGPILWLPRSESVMHQLEDFLQQLRRAAPGRRLHVVTDNAAVVIWLRSLRSRDPRVNVVAHLAEEPRAWSDLMSGWVWTGDDSTEEETLSDTVRRLRGNGHRLSWQQPAPGPSRP